MRNLNHIALVCPCNDPESLLIVRLAYHFGPACTVICRQEQGAALYNERQILERLQRCGREEVWIVEIPDPHTESMLLAERFKVVVIDHHLHVNPVFGTLDRRSDAQTGCRLQSSLEQFLTLIGVTDTEMVKHGFMPRLVRGIGIFDNQGQPGLKDCGYSDDEVRAVLDYFNALERCIAKNRADIIG